jgi:hypothetical protein
LLPFPDLSPPVLQVELDAALSAEGLATGAFVDHRLYADDPTVSATNTLVIIALALEVVVLILAEGFQPLHFLRSKTNVTNLLLLGGSIYAGIRPNPEVLLVLFFHHLFYFIKLAKAVRSRRLDGVIAGLQGGLKSVHHISFLLLLVFYVYAVIGTLLLGRNDPFHFGTLHSSLITLFGMSSLDSWSSVMEVSIYGCNNTVGYPKRNSAVLSPVNAVNATHDPAPALADTLCDNPHAHGFNVAIFFVSFVFISAYGESASVVRCPL